ncbi:hypothetical protein NDU88_004947 [Pleurodeles waltl]|uniref:Uncharacterized protein n=1 Tax=Pleurodeles waltl TaxID=8319 RepID=A0AAV7LN63_PLEWA|nr:hypothetical protein NDU88_004947 [Pleurodeles waltl]
MGREQALHRRAIPGMRDSRTPMPHSSPRCLSISAPSARGPGAEQGHGPGQQTHQARPRASAEQAASSSSTSEATPEPRRGTPHPLVVPNSRADGTRVDEGTSNYEFIGEVSSMDIMAGGHLKATYDVEGNGEKVAKTCSHEPYYRQL